MTEDIIHVFCLGSYFVGFILIASALLFENKFRNPFGFLLMVLGLIVIFSNFVELNGSDESYMHHALSIVFSDDSDD